MFSLVMNFFYCRGWFFLKFSTVPDQKSRNGQTRADQSCQKGDKLANIPKKISRMEVIIGVVNFVIAGDIFR